MIPINAVNINSDDAPTEKAREALRAFVDHYNNSKEPMGAEAIMIATAGLSDEEIYYILKKFTQAVKDFTANKV
jgi:hypothetical protein